MPYVITDACIDPTGRCCMDVFPVACSDEGDRMLSAESSSWAAVYARFFRTIGPPAGASGAGGTRFDGPAVAAAGPA